MLTRKYLTVDEDGELYEYDIDRIINQMVRTGALRRALKKDLIDIEEKIDAYVKVRAEAAVFLYLREAKEKNQKSKLERIREILEEDEDD